MTTLANRLQQARQAYATAILRALLGYTALLTLFIALGAAFAWAV